MQNNFVTMILIVDHSYIASKSRVNLNYSIESHIHQLSRVTLIPQQQSDTSLWNIK